MPTVIATLLGSCVAVCLWDTQRGIGGMNHIVLPGWNGTQRGTRFGPDAMRQLLAGLRGFGAQLPAVRAKLFGGAAVLPIGTDATSVGSENVRFALAWLRENGIPLVAQRTGGQRGVALRFVTSTGEVQVRQLAGGPALVE